jgi:hypothetical protein
MIKISYYGRTEYVPTRTDPDFISVHFDVKELADFKAIFHNSKIIK